MNSPISVDKIVDWLLELHDRVGYGNINHRDVEYESKYSSQRSVNYSICNNYNLKLHKVEWDIINDMLFTGWILQKDNDWYGTFHAYLKFLNTLIIIITNDSSLCGIYKGVVFYSWKYSNSIQIKIFQYKIVKIWFLGNKN